MLLLPLFVVVGFSTIINALYLHPPYSVLFLLIASTPESPFFICSIEQNHTTSSQTSDMLDWSRGAFDSGLYLLTPAWIPTDAYSHHFTSKVERAMANVVMIVGLLLIARVLRTVWLRVVRGVRGRHRVEDVSTRGSGDADFDYLTADLALDHRKAVEQGRIEGAFRSQLVGGITAEDEEMITMDTSAQREAPGQGAGGVHQQRQQQRQRAEDSRSPVGTHAGGEGGMEAPLLGNDDLDDGKSNGGGAGIVADDAVAGWVERRAHEGEDAAGDDATMETTKVDLNSGSSPNNATRELLYDDTIVEEKERKRKKKKEKKATMNLAAREEKEDGDPTTADGADGDDANEPRVSHVYLIMFYAARVGLYFLPGIVFMCTATFWSLPGGLVPSLATLVAVLCSMIGLGYGAALVINFYRCCLPRLRFRPWFTKQDTKVPEWIRFVGLPNCLLPNGCWAPLSDSAKFGFLFEGFVAGPNITGVAVIQVLNFLLVPIIAGMVGDGSVAESTATGTCENYRFIVLVVMCAAPPIAYLTFGRFRSVIYALHAILPPVYFATVLLVRRFAPSTFTVTTVVTSLVYFEALQTSVLAILRVLSYRAETLYIWDVVFVFEQGIHRRYLERRGQRGSRQREQQKKEGGRRDGGGAAVTLLEEEEEEDSSGRGGGNGGALRSAGSSTWGAAAADARKTDDNGTVMPHASDSAFHRGPPPALAASSILHDGGGGAADDDDEQMPKRCDSPPVQQQQQQQTQQSPSRLGTAPSSAAASKTKAIPMAPIELSPQPTPPEQLEKDTDDDHDGDSFSPEMRGVPDGFGSLATSGLTGGGGGGGGNQSGEAGSGQADNRSASLPIDAEDL